MATVAAISPFSPRVQLVIDGFVLGVTVLSFLVFVGNGVGKADDWSDALSAFCLVVTVGSVYGIESSRPLLTTVSAPAAFVLLRRLLTRLGVYSRVRAESAARSDAWLILLLLNGLAVVPFVLPRRGFVAITLGILAATTAVVWTLRWGPRLFRGARVTYLTVVACVLFGAIYMSRTPLREASLSEIARAIDDERPVRVELGANEIRVLLRSGEWIRAAKEKGHSGTETLRDLGVDAAELREIPIIASVGLLELDADVAVTALVVIVALAIIWMLFTLTRANTQQSKRQRDFTESRDRLFASDSRKATFDEIVGAKEAKLALQEIAVIVADPSRVTKLGGRPRRGVLLVGPPGTGKTLLARALATSVKAPFHYVSASDFVEMYVGVGAARIRDLFAKARKTAPSVVFIDEIDGLGRRRGSGSAPGSNDEREQALNQILVELDGFGPNTGVIVIAATNRADVLDDALMRPGRFDRRIEVPRPTADELQELLRVHTARVALGQTFDPVALVRNLPGATGADIEAIVNEAVQNAATRAAATVEQQDFERALELTGKLVRPVVIATVRAAVCTTVFGQDESVRRVAMAVGQHYSDLRSNETRRGSKPNVLISGPPGVGKTSLISGIAKAMAVPFARIDANAIIHHPSAFLVGLERLLVAANSDIRAAERGIVCIEGSEAFLKAGSGFSHEELARWIDGTSFDVIRSVEATGRPTRIDTSGVLFVLEATSTPRGRAFAFEPGDGAGLFPQKKGSPGYSRRLLDRLPIVVVVPGLTASAMRTILDGGGASLIERATRRYEDMEYAITVERPDGLDALIEEAMRRGGGARSLARILDELLIHEVAVEERPGVDGRRITISKATVHQFLARSGARTSGDLGDLDPSLGSSGVWAG